MHNIYKILCICLALTSPKVWAFETAEAFCENYYKTLGEKGLMAVPKFIHPDELVRFKNMFIGIVDPNGEQLNKNELLHFFFGPSATFESVKLIPPERLMRQVMYVAVPHTKGVRITTKILGSVKENTGDITHVVVRLYPNFPGTEVEVLSVRRFGSSWKILISSRLDEMLRRTKEAQAKS
ncbi:MAG: hypothetical protein NTV43_02490 [Methylococcales bacterium]|nr:hypothetical protein [Methylococcales bacterium]